MSYESSLPTEIRLINSTLKNRIINGKYHQPIAYVEIVDTDSSVTNLVTCTNFSVSKRRDDILGSFSCTISQASDWNPRSSDHLDLLSLDKRKIINIYYGQVIDGTNHYVKIFTGIANRKPETYRFGTSDFITLRGVSLGYWLEKLAGSYSSNTFTGTSKDLLKYWLDAAGLEYTLSYTDTIDVEDLTIAYSNALAGFNAILTVLGPSKEAFFDSDGILVVRDIPDWSANDVEFAYDENNIVALSNRVDIDKVTTVADIAGNSAVASKTTEASSAMLDKYGRNIATISSGLITTLTQATNLASDLLSHGESFENPVQSTIILNPYLTIGSFITVEDSALSSTPETQIRIYSIVHTYTAMQTHRTRIEGYPQNE